MPEKKFSHRCECTHCGNEAEMVVTCSLEQEPTGNAVPKVVAEGKGTAKGQAVCSHCGGEADIWLEL